MLNTAQREALAAAACQAGFSAAGLLVYGIYFLG